MRPRCAQSRPRGWPDADGLGFPKSARLTGLFLRLGNCCFLLKFLFGQGFEPQSFVACVFGLLTDEIGLRGELLLLVAEAAAFFWRAMAVFLSVSACRLAAAAASARALWPCGLVCSNAIRSFVANVARSASSIGPARVRCGISGLDLGQGDDNGEDGKSRDGDLFNRAVWCCERAGVDNSLDDLLRGGCGSHPVTKGLGVLPDTIQKGPPNSGMD